MSKSCCFAVVLAVICLPVILLSLEADAQPTVDETATCGSSTPGEVVNMFKIIASSQQENAKKINDVKELLESKKDCDAAEPSKQPLVSALVCKFLVSFAFSFAIVVQHTLYPKNVTALSRYNSEIHESILIIFGTNVTEKVGYQKVLCFPIPST